MKLKVIAIIGAVALGLAAATYLPRYLFSYEQHEGMNRVDAELAAMTSAMEGYKNDFGTYPEMRNASVYRALSGDNPRHKRYFDFPKLMVSPTRQIIDPWGTAYEFGLVEGYPQIRSAGRNRHFETGGDDHSTGE